VAQRDDAKIHGASPRSRRSERGVGTTRRGARITSVRRAGKPVRRRLRRVPSGLGCGARFGVGGVTAPRGCSRRAPSLHHVHDDAAGVDQHHSPESSPRCHDVGAGVLQLVADVPPSAFTAGRTRHWRRSACRTGCELADIEEGDVARLDVFESGDGGLLELVKSHPGRR